MQQAFLCRLDHADILADGDKGAREAADVRARHDAALFDRVVEHGERGRGAVAAHTFEAELFENMRDRIPHHRRRRQREVDDTELGIQALGRLFGDQLPGTRDLEGRSLDHLGGVVQVGVGDIFEGVLDDARAGDADVDDGAAFSHAVEGARHEGVVLHRIGKDDELCTAEPVLRLGALCRLLHDLAHQAHGVHVDAGL